MPVLRPTRPKSSPVDTRDLGFGSRVTERTRGRFLNRDGTFNVERHGIPYLRSLHIYHALVTMSWHSFFAAIVLGYLLINALFAVGYFLCGAGALQGTASLDWPHRLVDAFFFSVQTLSTIGYGQLSPSGLAANLLVTLQSVTSVLFFAVSWGMVFARFSRPVARILFSDQAVIAPYHGIAAFEFRTMNALRSQIVDLDVRVVFTHVVPRDGRLVRHFDELILERHKVTFFPLHLTVVHPIDDRSPLRGMTARDLEENDAEFIVLLTGFDETFSHTVNARTSYKFHEIVVGARFVDMYIPTDDGQISVDVRKLHDIEPADLPVPGIPEPRKEEVAS